MSASLLTNQCRTSKLSLGNCLPGDCKDGAAFGFGARGVYAGQGDGNGVIQGVMGNGANLNNGTVQGLGETVVFWADLSAANLIDGIFTRASSTASSGIFWLTATTSPGLGDYFPRGKIGQSTYVLVYSGGSFNPPWSNWQSTGIHYFSLQGVADVQSGQFIDATSPPGLNVQNAYAIDSKTDDGLPQSGSVVAQYVYYQILWAGASNGYNFGAGITGTPTTTATPGSSTTCYDNGNVAGTAQQYSIGQNSGGGNNCALSFRAKF